MRRPLLCKSAQPWRQAPSLILLPSSVNHNSRRRFSLFPFLSISSRPSSTFPFLSIGTNSCIYILNSCYGIKTTIMEKFNPSRRSIDLVNDEKCHRSLEPLFDSYFLYEDELDMIFWYSSHSDNRVMVLCDSPRIPTCDLEDGAS
jgi:hypothetical protein